MASFRDLLKAAKSEITEVDTEGAAERIAAGSLVLDVREPDEYDAGALADAVLRGSISQILPALVGDPQVVG